MKKSAVFICVLLLLFPAFTYGCKKIEQGQNVSYEINCELDGHILTGSEKVNFTNTSNNVLKELKFNLFGNAFRKDAIYSPISAQYVDKAYPNGLSYGSMQIHKTFIGNNESEFTISGIDKNILIIRLNNELFPDEEISVKIEFTLNLANVIARTGYNEKTINLANFYPIMCAFSDGSFYECVYYSFGDPFYSDCADYLVKLTCDKKYVVASSGVEKSKKVNGNKITATYKINNARSFAFVLSQDFKCEVDDSTGIKINYYYYDDSQPKNSIQYAVRAMQLFEKKFGAYPYKTFSVVQTGFIQGGMEFPALVMISDELEGLPYGEVIVHETAHQWWQTAVGNNEIENGFLDEGLAEYSVILFYENFPEYGYTRQSLVKSSEQTYKVFCSVYDKLQKKVDTTMIRSLKDFSSEYEYVNVAYIKSCIMYDYLRTTIGEERFFNALKKYYTSYKFKNATPDDLVGAFEKTYADTNGFFTTFFEGKEII